MGVLFAKTASGATYRDIRADLQDRLDSAIASRDEHVAKANEYGVEADELKRLIEREDRRFAAVKDTPEVTSLTDFIVDRLGQERMSKDSLRNLAASHGYDVDGRSIHATLVNLTRTGKVKEGADGTFFAG